LSVLRSTKLRDPSPQLQQSVGVRALAVARQVPGDGKCETRERPAIETRTLVDGLVVCRVDDRHIEKTANKSLSRPNPVALPSLRSRYCHRQSGFFSSYEVVLNLKNRVRLFAQRASLVPAERPLNARHSAVLAISVDSIAWVWRLSTV
jgi:hypothetical protein